MYSRPCTTHKKVYGRAGSGLGSAGLMGRLADGLGLGRQKTRRNAVHTEASGLKGRLGRLFPAAACTLKGYGVGLA